MLGDVLLISEKHHRAAEQIVAQLENAKPRTVLAIGGESGTGKTELAHVVSKLLKKQGRLTKVLHVDNYYLVAPEKRTQWRKEHGVERVGLSEINWDLVNRHLAAFRAGVEAVLPCIDLLTDQEDMLITSFENIELLILEGLYPLNADVDLRILIDLTYHETKKAQIVRGKEPQTAFRLQVLQQEHLAVQSLKPMADLLVTPEFNVMEAPHV
jgi:uridine kinase